MTDNPDNPITLPFYAQPDVALSTLLAGVPLGVKQVYSPSLGIGGAYGAWGQSYDNNTLPIFIANRLGEPLSSAESMELSNLGFIHRHHIGDLSEAEHLEVELAVGAHMLQAAMQANRWQPDEVNAVMIGMSGPAADDYVEQIAQRAGIPQSAIKVSVHKACDSSVGALNLALNPHLQAAQTYNLAEELYGKKVLVGGIEGLSRFTSRSRDKNALQLFGNGAGVIGVVPGESMKFLVGKDHENFDEEGVLAVSMYYPHSRRKVAGESLVEVSQENSRHIRVAGLMHEPESGAPVEMAGPMGMVKLFVRTGVEVVSEVYQAYCQLMARMGMPDKALAVSVVHHANYKINQLKKKHLDKLGIPLAMPWLLSEFGNVSAASNMIAFLRQLPHLKPGDHIMIDGFGAGTYYDVLAVALPG